MDTEHQNNLKNSKQIVQNNIFCLSRLTINVRVPWGQQLSGTRNMVRGSTFEDLTTGPGSQGPSHCSIQEQAAGGTQIIPGPSTPLMTGIEQVWDRTLTPGSMLRSFRVICYISPEFTILQQLVFSKHTKTLFYADFQTNVHYKPYVYMVGVRTEKYLLWKLCSIKWINMILVSQAISILSLVKLQEIGVVPTAF